jgi:hypothetical protein
LRVGVVARLRDGRSGVRISAGERDFLFSKTIQTASGVYTASYSMGIVVFPGGEGLGRSGDKEVDHVIRSSALVKNECSYTSSPPIHLHGVNRDRLSFYFSVDADDVRTTDRDD